MNMGLSDEMQKRHLLIRGFTSGRPEGPGQISPKNRSGEPASCPGTQGLEAFVLFDNIA